MHQRMESLTAALSFRPMIGARGRQFLARFQARLIGNGQQAAGNDGLIYGC
jgi:hypothetical protein